MEQDTVAGTVAGRGAREGGSDLIGRRPGDREGRVSLLWRIVLAALRYLPQGLLSRACGRLAVLPIPRPLRKPLLGLFVRLVGIDLSEAELPLDEYRSVNRLFVRRLKPGARQVVLDPQVAVSPVDAVVGEVGVTEKGKLLQVKGHWYAAANLLDDAEQAVRFEGGCYATLYLTPRHYHRIHCPCQATVAQARHVPGRLLPVNPPAVLSCPDLFARNERLVCYLDGPLGRVAVAAVGAFNVGRISAAFDPQWNQPDTPDGGVTNTRGAVAQTRIYNPPLIVDQGGELMAFHLGSTVVVLFEPGRVDLAPELIPGREIRMGRPIARQRSPG